MMLIVFLFLAISSFAQDAARMDQVVQTYVGNKQFMGSVLVARGSEVLLSKGYGFANAEWEIPNTPSTKFRLGSITKQFTAASILLLEERGKLKIEDPIKTHLPAAPATWDQITIYHLLTHTSGIPSFTGFPDYQQFQHFSTTAEGLYGRFRDKPLDFQPGERYTYNNSGYVLLGYLIERISGKTYEQFVQENFFTPLAMKDSGYDSNSAIIPRRAAGYAPSPNGPVNAGFVHMTVPHAAGALYSTVEDLFKWEQSLFAGKVLSAASLQKMTTPFKNDYGFGLAIRTASGRKVIEHGGGIQGFNTSLAYYPDSKVTIAVLGNLNGRAPDEIAGKLAPLAHGESAQLSSERKEIKLPVETLKRYAGTYQVAPNVQLWISVESDQLIGQLSGQGKLPHFAESETKFFLKAVDAQLEFFKDPEGKVTHAVIYQNGREVRAARTSDTIPAERKEIVVPGAILNQYTGTFEIVTGFDLTITLEGNQLMAQATGQGKFAIVAETETKFFAKTIDIQIEFGKDESGKVTQLTLRQGPVPTRTAKRK